MRRAAAVAALALLAAPSALAFAPGPADAVAIVAATGLKVPAGCVSWKLRVSPDRTWSRAEPVFLPGGKCGRYASNGVFLLRFAGGRWKVAWNGSGTPPCKLGAPATLIACR